MLETGEPKTLSRSIRTITPLIAGTAIFFTFTSQVALQDASAVFTAGLDSKERWKMTTAALSKIQTAAEETSAEPKLIETAPRIISEPTVKSPEPVLYTASIGGGATNSRMTPDAIALAERLGLRLPKVAEKADMLVPAAAIQNEVAEVERALGLALADGPAYPTSNRTAKADPLPIRQNSTLAAQSDIEPTTFAVSARFVAPLSTPAMTVVDIAAEPQWPSYSFEDTKLGYANNTHMIPFEIEAAMLGQAFVRTASERPQTDGEPVANKATSRTLLAALPESDQYDLTGDLKSFEVAMPIPRELPDAGSLYQVASLSPDVSPSVAALPVPAARDIIVSDAETDVVPEFLPKAVYAALLPRPKVPENIRRAENAIASVENGVNALKDWKKGPSKGKRKKLSRAQQQCLAEAIYFEARGEPHKGQLAVAQVVINRAQSKHWPNTVCGVVYQNKHWRNRCQFSFACDGKKERINDRKSWAEAKDIAKKFSNGYVYKPVERATHYHATYVRPKWARYFRRIDKIGIHVFYRSRTGGWS